MRQWLLVGCGSTALMSAQIAHAQNATAPQVQAADDSATGGRSDIVVTGYRESVQAARNAKRDATNVSDSIMVCLGKTGPILKRACEGERIGEMYGTSAIYAGADHREAA